MRSNLHMIKNLRNAINLAGHKVTFTKSEVFLADKQFPKPMYIIKKSVWDEKRHRNKNIELFHTFSEIQAVLYLRDYWFRINGWELPEADEEWEEIRKKLEEQ